MGDLDPNALPDTAPEAGEITRLLEDWSAGDTAAFDRLFPLLYPQLKRLAERQIRREGPGHTLQTTALVHEAFLDLVDQRRARFESRGQFLGVAAFLMRRILAEHARAKVTAKRGGGAVHVELDEARDAGLAVDDCGLAEVAAVDEALDRFAAIDPRAARVVVLRFFGGLSHDETAAALGLSPVTVKRDWAVARAWLKRELAGR